MQVKSRKNLKSVSPITTTPVRLSSEEIRLIKQTFSEIFGNGHVILFGSRVDIEQRGGDIDLYLVLEDKKDMRKKKIDFLIKLDMLLGEQKIDVVIAQDKNSLFEKEALAKGVKL